MRSGRILRVDDVVKPHRGLHVIENDPDDDGVFEGARSKETPISSTPATGSC
jgi:hypothetical protein